MKFNAELRGISFTLHVSCVGMIPKRVLAVWLESTSKTSATDQMHTETNASDQTHTETNTSCVIETNSRVGSGSNAGEVAVSFKSNDRDGLRIIGANTAFMESSGPSVFGQCLEIGSRWIRLRLMGAGSQDQFPWHAQLW